MADFQDNLGKLVPENFFNEARDNGTKNKDQNHHRLFGMAAMHAKCTQLQ